VADRSPVASPRGRARRPAITTAAEAIALELKALGTSHFFLVTGGDNSVWIALQEQGITQVLARNEASSV
jgi:thiamine pyrophosphate-dependent acetolactate synthase large subunit-like protein